MNRSRLFYASCVALDFGFNDTQLGYMNAMAFLGFPVATIIGGALYNSVGPKRIMMAAFVFHILGLLLTIFAGGFWGLLISTFFIGLANGSVEAGANPMIAEMYKEDKSTWLNKFHVWFPGGLAIGALISFFMKGQGFDWQSQIAIMFIPTLLYAFLLFGQKFPETTELEADTSKNTVSLFTPLFIFMAICMTLTAVTELGTQQWVEKLLAKTTGVEPLLILAMVTSLMAVGRYFAGPVIHRLNPAGVLWASAIISTIALVWLSQVTGIMVYPAAILFAVGVMYFWPTMLGFVSEYMPETGALGLGVIGAAGMAATGIWQPVIGGWLDSAKEKAITSGIGEKEAELIAGQATLDNLAVFPAILILAFGILYFYMRRRKKMSE